MQLRVFILGLGAALLAGTIWFGVSAEDGKSFVQQASAQPPEAARQESTQPAAPPPIAQPNTAATGSIVQPATPLARPTTTPAQMAADLQAKCITFMQDFWNPGLPSLHIPRARLAQGLGVEFATADPIGPFRLSTTYSHGLFVMAITGAHDDIYTTILAAVFLGGDNIEPTVMQFMKAITLTTPKWSQSERMAWLGTLARQESSLTQSTVTPEYHVVFKSDRLEGGAVVWLAGISASASVGSPRTPVSASSSGRRLPLSATDPRNLFEVTIHRVLSGRQCVRAGVAYDFEWERAAKAGKQLVYLDVSVKRVEGAGWRVPRDEHRLSCNDFKLVDTSGLTYSAELPNDALRGKIHKGRSARGGIMFAIYRENVPAELFYDPSITDSESGRPLFVHFDSLQTLNVW